MGRGVVRAERAAFARTLLATRPDAPTLCEGWTAADLAAHVVVRERRLDADLSLLIRIESLRGWTDRVRDRERDRRPYPGLVARLARPSWPLRLLPFVDELVNDVELAVHHEDVRRGAAGWEPRPIDPALDGRLWRKLVRFAPLSFRGDRSLRVQLATPDGRRATIHAAADGATVRLVGPTIELLLYAYGRRRAARVEVTGDAEALERLRALELRA
jgi:uncharacterized protein (TIGR03085 family)